MLKFGKDKFNIGDIVKLISGGPDMAVVGNEMLVQCAWFSGDDSNSASFPADALVLVKAAEKQKT